MIMKLKTFIMYILHGLILLRGETVYMTVYVVHNIFRLFYIGSVI
jgi:hypothetical protein